MPTVTGTIVNPSEAAPLKGDGVVAGFSAPQRWRHGLCDCFGDCCVCMAVCCCWAVTPAQIYEKAVRANLCQRTMGCGCMGIFLLLALLYILNDVFNSIAYSYYNNITFADCCDQEFWESLNQDNSDHKWAFEVAEVCLFFASIITCCIVCHVRQQIRRRDQIPATICPETCEDCCCAWCCGPCTECQLLRHEGVTSAKYSLCSPIAVKV